MYFEYPYLLWLLVLPALLVLRYLWIEWKDRRVHMRVSALDAWKAGGRSVLEIVRHLPFLLRTAALCLLIVAIARPRSSTQVEKVDTEGIDILFAMDVSTSMLARDFQPDRLSAARTSPSSSSPSGPATGWALWYSPEKAIRNVPSPRTGPPSST